MVRVPVKLFGDLPIHFLNNNNNNNNNNNMYCVYTIKTLFRMPLSTSGISLDSIFFEYSRALALALSIFEERGYISEHMLVPVGPPYY